jgi:predicted nucleic acid-binding protein
LALLHDKYPDGVLIPVAVWREVVEQGEKRAGARKVDQADWITVHDVKNREMVQILEEKADVVLLDERDARRAAKQLGLRVLGTVGVLVWAKQGGKIASLRENLDKLKNMAKFRISQTLYDRALGEVGEQENE